MSSSSAQSGQQEYDFALIVGGVPALSQHVEDALFNAGCDDATLSIQYGQLFMEFSRSAASIKDAILSAIRDVQKSGIPARVLRVDDCNLVTAAEIARRIDRSRQLVHQYISGTRGPGGFPPPCCHIADHSPLWAWCAVSFWLVQNNLLRSEESRNALVVDAINKALETKSQPQQQELVEALSLELTAIGI